MPSSNHSIPPLYETNKDDPDKKKKTPKWNSYELEEDLIVDPNF